MTAPTRPRPATHACPGGCGTQIPRQKLSCREHWYQLPRELRNRISNNYRRNPDEHMRAIADAVAWYAEHPGG